MDGLDRFINSLDEAIKEIPKKTNLYTKKLFSLILFEIGKRTSYDNGVTRSIIQEVLNELGQTGLSSQLQEKIYGFWKSLEARLENSHNYYFKEDNGSMFLVIEDYGFANQAIEGVVSSTHPRNDPLVIPMQVDFVIDAINLEQFGEIEKSLDVFLDVIVNTIEKGR